MSQLNNLFTTRGVNVLLPWVLAFSTLNFMTGIAEYSQSGIAWLYVGIFAGGIAAQFVLHAIWCVLAPYPTLPRVLIGIAMGAVLLGANLAGIAFQYLNLPHSEFSGLAVEHSHALSGFWYLPIIVVALQFPLWLMRSFFSWRIVCDGSDRGGSPLLIRNILVGTTFVAVALGALRVAMGQFEEVTRDEFMYLLGLSTVSLFAAPPMLVTVLRVTGSWRAAIGIVFSGLPVFIVLSVTALLQGAPVAVVVYLFYLTVSFYGCVGGALLATRWQGYGLVWGRRATAGEDDGAGETAISTSPSRGMTEGEE